MNNFKVLALFQFPSNGKAYPKSKLCKVCFIRMLFQFPSNGKAYPKQPRSSGCRSDTYARFNSLQTGKRIQRVIKFSEFVKRGGVVVSIPFKRESVSKGPHSCVGVSQVFCFNSLQTGKRIQRTVTSAK